MCCLKQPKATRHDFTALWEILTESSVSTKFMPRLVLWNRTSRRNYCFGPCYLEKQLSCEGELKARPSAQSWVWNNKRFNALLVGQKEMRKNSCEADFSAQEDHPQPSFFLAQREQESGSGFLDTPGFGRCFHTVLAETFPLLPHCAVHVYCYKEWLA